MMDTVINILIDAGILEIIGVLEIDVIKMLELTMIGVVVIGFVLYKFQTHRILWWISIILSVVWFILFCLVLLYELLGLNFTLPIL